MLRERTLRHLMLVVGRTLQSLPENSEFKNELHEICDSLEVQREKRGPYELKWTRQGISNSLKVESSRFRFHERGDVPARVEDRKDLNDARTHNWQEAVQVWTEMLPDISMLRTTKLAPIRSKTPTRTSLKESKWQLLLYIAVAITGLILSQSLILSAALGLAIPLIKPSLERVMAGSIITVIGIFAEPNLRPLLAVVGLVLLLQQEEMFRSRFTALFTPVAALGASALVPRAGWAIALLLAFEIMSDQVSRNRIRLILKMLSLFAVLGISEARTNFHLQITVATAVVCIAALTLCLVALPRSVDKNLFRISAPLMVVILVVQQSLHSTDVLAALMCWLIGILWPNKYAQTLVNEGVPVTIKKSGLSAPRS